MNRIDRLTAMILMLQSQRVVTAEQIAEHFEISVRTVYRDIAALGEGGVPIVAEAGVGYALMRGYHMPPVMFTEAEAAALFMAGELTEQLGDESLKEALSSALLKVRAALPSDHKDYLSRLGNSISVTHRPSEARDQSALMPIQEAVVRRRCLELKYNAGGLWKLSHRVIEPLGMVYYGHHWHVIGWCRLREAIRDFRLDRMDGWQVLPEIFQAHEDFSLIDFLEHEVDCKQLIPVSMECECWVLDRVLSEMPAQIVTRSKPVDGRVQMEALAYSLDWMAGFLLGLGTAVLAHSPPELGDKIAAKASAVAKSYRCGN